MRLVRSVLLAVIALAVLGAVGAWGVRRFSDGPLPPLPGGPFRSGELVNDAQVDWVQALLNQQQQLELQLVNPPESRVTAFVIYQGALYIPADSGFLAERVPNAGMRWMGELIVAVKHWPKDAERDGRVVIRANGKLYEQQAVRVTDPELLAVLRGITEKGVEKFFGAPLLNVPGDPEKIWFFRLDPR